VSQAWRPVDADNFMFIHCMYVYSKNDRNKGLGSQLVKEAEKDAKAKNMAGLCVMTSKGAWITDKRLFEMNGFKQVDKRGRFELMSKKWDLEVPEPKLIDWTTQQKKYEGWHLVYADQCPWHEKSAEALLNVAGDFGIDLKVSKIETAQEAKNAPSGFGVFNLLHDGRLLEDHYLSATRFRNILKAELQAN
ncbi:MAG: YoaP domain-containing protein, partial [Flavobacteriaceae bacterium]|nr:YoaP domain-containing protein [Flavobacteriaceae bacterium]